MVDHEFGGLSTDLKLSVIEKYLRAYTTALRGRWQQLWYIDAFAGTGYRAIKHAARPGGMLGDDAPEWTEYRRGSAVIALETEPIFDRIIFIENKPSHCAALKQLMAENPTRDITLDESDANLSIRKNVAWDGWSSTRAVMFLDPYGLSVDWTTVEAIAATKAIDLWYLVSLEGLFRQATHEPEKLSEEKRNALTRMLGTSEWETAWYAEEIVTDIFGDRVVPKKRTADITAMETFVHDRLATVFPKVLPPLRLLNTKRVPTFALFFAVANPEPKAIGLATKIAGQILEKASAGSSS